ncbi:MAG: hypothetical protein AAGA34_05595 [Pseudomonadota bacterium]
MYARFTAPAAAGQWSVTRAHVDPGFFRSGYDVWSGEASDPVKIAIRQELDWFNEYLPVPSRLAVKAKRVWHRDGVCWFREDAAEVLRHAFVLASLIEASGIRIDRTWTRDPGQILYRDKWQVVAKPERRRLN